MLFELDDQTVREHPGGEMVKFAGGAPPSQHEFIRQRIGGELARMRSGVDSLGEPQQRGNVTFVHWPADAALRKAVRLLIGRDGIRAYNLGRFRPSGEIHYWTSYYYFLRRILERAGFSTPRRVGPADSNIPGCSNYHLDTELAGNVYKLDSLYMEATRP